MNEIEKSKTELAVLKAIIDDLNKAINSKTLEASILSKEILKARQKVFKVIVGRCYKDSEDTIFMVSDVPDYGTYSNWINFSQIPCLMLDRVENTISFEEVFLRGGEDIENEQALLVEMEKQYTPISKEEFIGYCKGHIDDMINGIEIDDMANGSDIDKREDK